MITGIGIDSVEVERIEKILSSSKAEKFLHKVYHTEEVLSCINSAVAAQKLAARFAAKEAFIKASGLTHISLKSVCVRNENTGKPVIILDENVENLFFQGKKIHLSITHTKKTASAVVVVEKIS